MSAAEIEAFLRKTYTVQWSERSEVLGVELHYLTAEVKDLAKELERYFQQRAAEGGA